jgi:DNA-binding beta-propeller fold protein YncE
MPTTAPTAQFSGTFTYGVFTYTLHQLPDGAITLRVSGFNPNLGGAIEPAQQTVVAGRAISLEARGINGNPDPHPPLVWQQRPPNNPAWTTLSSTDARLWLDPVSPLSHDGATYRFIAQSALGTTGTSLHATLRVRPELTEPAHIATTTGHLYIANQRDHIIQKITLAGAITTLAGAPRQRGSLDGTGTAARFHSPQGIAATTTGDLYIADTANHTIRKITPAPAPAAPTVTTLAGAPGQPDFTDGTGTAARFHSPAAIAATPDGDTLYIADTTNHTIRKITTTGPAAPAVTTLAGAPGQRGSNDGPAADARFHSPQGIAISAATGDLYIADTGNHAIRKIAPDATVTTLGADTPGGTTLITPRGLAVDDARTLLYIADADTHAIYASDIGPGPDGGGRILVPIAGAELDPDIRDALADSARFNTPWGLAMATNRTLYIADHANAALRQLTPAGTVTTLNLVATTDPGTGGNNNNSGGGGNTGTTSSGGGAPAPALPALLAALLLARALLRTGNPRQKTP